MVDTVTVNYSWTKPEVGASGTTWGTKQNGVFDLIDAQVFANQQAIAKSGSNVGDVKMFAGAAAPTNWLMCDGAVYLNTAIPLLAPVLANKFNAGTGAVAGTSNAVPNLQMKFPIGASSTVALGATGGEATHVLTAAEMPIHTHGVSQTPHSHGINDPTHTHGVNDPSHTHGASQDAHSHGLDHIPMTSSAGGNGAAGGGWGFATTRTDAQQPAVHVNAAGTGIWLSGAATGVSAQAANANVANANAGGGAAHNNNPPYLAINFIIRYQ